MSGKDYSLRRLFLIKSWFKKLKIIIIIAKSSEQNKMSEKQAKCVNIGQGIVLFAVVGF